MDLKDLFSDGIKGFLSDLINDALKQFDKLLGSIVDVALNADTYMKSNLNMDFTGLYAVLFSYGIYLIVLKFLKKGFNTYVLWSDGDPDMDPSILCINFIKAIAIAMCYASLYDVGTQIISALIDSSLASMNDANVEITADTISQAISGLLSKGLLFVIVAVIYLILYILLWIQFIKRGFELFILKCGVPLASSGLMDSDGGVFKIYTKKIIQELFTVFVQIVLLKISLVLMINVHFLFGIAAISSALKTPQFLSEFIMAAAGGGGAMGKVTQASMIIRNFKK